MTAPQNLIYTLATLTYASGTWTPSGSITAPSGSSFLGYASIEVISDTDLWLRAEWFTAQGVSCQFFGTCAAGLQAKSLHLGIIDEVTTVVFYAQGKSNSDMPTNWGAPVATIDVSHINNTSTIQINQSGTITDPAGNDNSTTAQPTDPPLNVTCSTGELTISLHSGYGGADLYYAYDTTDTPTKLDPGDNTLTPETQTMVYITTCSTNAQSSDPRVNIRHSDRSVVVLFEDGNNNQYAWPAFVQPDAANRVYVVNLTSDSASTTLKGWDTSTKSWSNGLDSAEVAPFGGVSIYDLNFVSTNHQSLLSWDVTDDPILVVMRPTNPPPSFSS